MLVAICGGDDECAAGWEDGGWENDELWDEEYETDSSDGFWSGRLQSYRPGRGDIGETRVVGESDEADEAVPYRDRTLKTFAYWQLATAECYDWRKPGVVEEGSVDGESSGDGGRAGGLSGEDLLFQHWLRPVENDEVMFSGRMEAWDACSAPGGRGRKRRRLDQCRSPCVMW